MVYPNSFQSGTNVSVKPPFALIASSALVLAGIALWFQISVDFVPTLNDIISIYKIAALNGPERWINGFYGPGYTVIHILAGDSFIPPALLSTTLMVISFVLVTRLTTLLLNGEYIVSLLTTMVFYLFLIAKLKTNYTDAIFIYLLFSGLSLYLHAYFNETKYRIRGRKRDLSIEMLWLLIAGSTVLFRYHGLVFLLVFVTVLTVLGPARLGQYPLRRIAGTYSAIVAVFAGLLLTSQFVREVQYVNWQTLNVYKFFFDINWYRVDLLLDSPSYINFSLFQTITEQPVYSLSRTALALYQLLIPVLLITGIPALGYIITKERFHLVVLLTVLIYMTVVLPGLDRGIYPLMLIVFLSFVLILHHSVKTLPGLAVMLILMLMSAGWSVYHILSERAALTEYNRYISHDLEEALQEMDARDASSLFTDDYNLVLFSYNTLDIRNFQGWLNLHPEFRKLQPNTVFRQQQFDEHEIAYVVYLRNGYISVTYPDLPCIEERTLNKHHICKL